MRQRGKPVDPKAAVGPVRLARRSPTGGVETVEDVAAAIRACRICAAQFDHEPKPILQVGPSPRIAIYSQAPGNLAHQKGRPFQDPSGVRLREWLGVDEAIFYDPQAFAIAPMAFCFPGYDAKGGDKPPPRICAKTWRRRLLAALPGLKLALLVGSYAQEWHLGRTAARTMTERVRQWRDVGPLFVPLPHPSWRNNAWLRKNPWFAEELLPEIRGRVADLVRQ
ncbi:MAG: uracil-DNA glycosylase family protein [Alphaproteobacteria bacterium]|nr:uracil-DNA glycosylase family protein [Alphaproteobacteria bacterium]